MSFLGVVIFSFGFRIFGQRKLMQRHAPEIFGSTILSSAFSLFATAAFAKLLGLTPGACGSQRSYQIKSSQFLKLTPLQLQDLDIISLNQVQNSFLAGGGCIALHLPAVRCDSMAPAAEICRALAPRSVTVALALPIAAQLQAPASIAAAGVALTGLLGSNSVQLLLDKTGYKDPIARGLATAGASHGLGTAALSGK